MAEWKKIIVSSSNAELTHITASAVRPLNLPNITGSDSTHPLVIDSSGNVTTGSQYALKSGGNTVGGQSLSQSIAIVGAGGSLIQTASSTQNVDFNSSDLYGIGSASFTGSITASTIDGTEYNIAGNDLATFANNTLVLGDTDLTTKITGSNLIISAAGGVTMSAIPDTIRPTNYLGVGPGGEIVQIKSDQVQGNSGVSGVLGLQVCDNGNINLSSSNQTTTSTQDLGATIVLGFNSKEVFISRGSNNLNGVITPQAGDTIQITTNNGGTIETFTTTIAEIDTDGGSLPKNDSGVSYMPVNDGTAVDGSGNNFPLTQTNIFDDNPGDSVEDTLTFNGFQSMSIANAFSSSDAAGLGKTIVGSISKITTGTSEGIVEICLDDNLNINNITSSGHILFSGSEFNSIGHHSASNLSISASIVTASTIFSDHYILNGFSFSDNTILQTSGSTQFGDSASQDTHTFTGSVGISGSFQVDSAFFISGAFKGDGNNITNLNNDNMGLHSLTPGNALSIGTTDPSGSTPYNPSSSDATINLEINTTQLQTTNDQLAIKAGGVNTNEIASNAVDNTKLDHIFTSATEGVGVVGNFGSSTEIPTITIDETGRITSASLNSISTTFNVQGDSGSTDEIAGGETLVIEGGVGLSTTSSLVDNKITINFDGDGRTFKGTTTFENVDIDGTLTVDGSNISLDSTNELNIDNTNTTNGIKIGTAHENVPITIGNASSETTIKDNLTVDGTLNVSGDSTLDNLTVGGNLIVNGSTTTINTTNIEIEDRFITIGSGSAAVETSLDMGIIFDSGIQDNSGADKGIAFYYDASDKRLAIAKDAADVNFANTNQNNIGDPGASGTNKNEIGGNIVTVRNITDVNGTALSTEIANHKHSASFGIGEMVVDKSNDIWIYTG